MPTFELIAERKIAEAAAKGEFDDLPGAGKPLDLEEDPLVPEDQRVANRIEARYFRKVVRKLGG